MFREYVLKNDKKVHRILESIPGVATWLLLLSPIWLGLLAPQVIVYILTFLTVYWIFLGVKHSYGMFIGYKKHKEEMSMNWLEECQKLNFQDLPDKKTLPSSLSEVRHFILIPAVNEPYEVLKDSLSSVINQTFPTKQMTLIYTIEERFAEKTKETINRILGEYNYEFEDVLIYAHPAGIPGEAIGAGAANRAWGAKHAVEEMISKGRNIRNYIMSTIDSDHVLDKQYYARLTHLYLSSDKRDNKFYTTAVHLFNNNRWRVPLVMRIEADSVSLGTLSAWTVSKRSTMDTFSSYAVSLQTLIDADFWDVSLGVDDTMFYWRAFFTRNGDFEGVPHFIPYSADAVEGKNYINSYVSLYKQLLRWGWGAIDFPLSVKGFLVNTNVKLSSKVNWLLKHFEKRVLLLNMVYLITFGFSIVTLVNPYVKQTNFAYSLPKIMSTLLTFNLIFFLPTTYFRLKLASPMPKEWNFLQKFLRAAEGPMVIVNMLTFSFFPFIEAQTRMIFGKKMKDLYHTPKTR